MIDRGPGVPEAYRDKMFAPFQRLGDTDSTTGVGLGLAVSRGLTEAMRGTLQSAQTPGGGLTMTMSLPAASRPARAHLPGCRPWGDWMVKRVTGSSRDRDHPWNFRICACQQGQSRSWRQRGRQASVEPWPQAGGVPERGVLSKSRLSPGNLRRLRIKAMYFL